MEHVVFYPASDGAPAFRRLATLEEAVRLVEHLRNVEGVSLVSVHALTEVPLAFRTYYRVEVPVAGEPTPVAAAPALGLVPEPVVPEPVVAEPLALEPLQDVAPLALAEPLQVAEPFRDDVQPQTEAEQAEQAVSEETAEDSPPPFAIANGRGGPSLGFFA